MRSSLVSFAVPMVSAFALITLCALGCTAGAETPYTNTASVDPSPADPTQDGPQGTPTSVDPVPTRGGLFAASVGDQGSSTSNPGAAADAGQ